MYVIVTEEIDEGKQTGAVKGAVPEQGPPCEGEHGTREYSAHADHEEDVEDGRADDGADADVVERHEHADYRCEEFRGRAAGRHEGSTRDIVRDLELLDDHVQRRDEELVADDRQGDEHVHDTHHVEYHGTASTFVDGEEIRGKEGRFLLGHVTADHLVMMVMERAVVAVFRVRVDRIVLVAVRQESTVAARRVRREGRNCRAAWLKYDRIVRRWPVSFGGRGPDREGQ